MQWIRSYPCKADRNMLGSRAHVHDGLTVLETTDYDYTPLGLIDDDVLLIEWDVAASAEDMRRFQANALNQPKLIRAAAHRLYHVDAGPVWAHRRYEPVHGIERWIHTGENWCDLAAFGMIYLPRSYIRRFLEAEAPERGRPAHLPRGSYGDRRFTDQTFSMWLYKQEEESIVVDWSCQPIHLHYTLPA